MKDEKIYSIPVNEAFNMDTECPVCVMYDKLEQDALEYTMGPSYMEDDIRAMTDEQGFCKIHMDKMSEMGNKLGIALMMKTHMDKVILDIEKAVGKSDGESKKISIFKKKDSNDDAVTAYVDKLNCSCFVCNRAKNTFDRYVDTVFYLWKSDADFKNTFVNSKGFCTSHYGLLRKLATVKLGSKADEFIKALDEIYLENMKRVRDDVEWFINKFDYKYANEPWKNAKDALPRGVIKNR